MRHDCGGCHAHSQQPTDFALTAAAKSDYKVWDLVNTTPLVADKSHDETKQQWDADDATGLRVAKSAVVDVEYHRDIRPILDRSCVACHTSKNGKNPAGKLDLDADGERVRVDNQGEFPGTYARLAMDERGQFGHKPVGYDSWGYPQASRYVRKFQSRRSVLMWKLHGKRLDGFSNDDHPSESKPGSGELTLAGQSVPLDKNRSRVDLDYTGSAMPPPDAVKAGKVQPLSDKDRRTFARWIDLGCPIDLDGVAERGDVAAVSANSAKDRNRSPRGWFLDDNRPIVTIAEPQEGQSRELDRILIGLHDYYSGLDLTSLSVTFDFAVDDAKPNVNLAERFKPVTQGVWELKLAKPIASMDRGTLTVVVRDRQGNTTKLADVLGRRFRCRRREGRVASCWSD